jgi:hypothetical protein
MVFIPETKTFPARQLCLLCGCKNDGNAVSRSILLVSKIVSKVPLVTAFSSRLVHALSSAQIFGSAVFSSINLFLYSFIPTLVSIKFGSSIIIIYNKLVRCDITVNSPCSSLFTRLKSYNLIRTNFLSVWK